MSIDVGRQMIEFSDDEKEKFDDFVATHTCKNPRKKARDLAPLLATIRIEACTIGYWITITCELCGEKRELSDISDM